MPACEGKAVAEDIEKMTADGPLVTYHGYGNCPREIEAQQTAFVLDKSFVRFASISEVICKTVPCSSKNLNKQRSCLLGLRRFQIFGMIRMHLNHVFQDSSLSDPRF